MAETKVTADKMEQSRENKRSFFQQRWIPGRHSESVIGLEDFIKKNYPSDDYLTQRFLDAVQQFDDSEHINSKQFDGFQRALIILSSLTSFFIALEALLGTSNVGASITFKLIALFFSLIVTILGNYMTSFNLQAKMGAYRLTREQLISEVYKFHEGIDNYAPSTDRIGNSTPTDEVDKTKKRRLFVSKVEEVIREANENWGKLHQNQGDAIPKSLENEKTSKPT